MLSNVTLLGDNSVRTRHYLRVLIARKVAPSHVVLISSRSPEAGVSATTTSGATDRSPEDIARDAGIGVTNVTATDINAPEVAAALNALGQSIVIFSVTGGALLRDPLLQLGKRFLHAHPGRLPEFRGSTTIYYSLLAGVPITVSAIFLTAAIDTGPIIASREYPAPADRREIDLAFDASIRADLLASVLAKYREKGRFGEQPQTEAEAETYYIIHPVLKHLAIMGSQPTAWEG